MPGPFLLQRAVSFDSEKIAAVRERARVEKRNRRIAQQLPGALGRRTVHNDGNARNPLAVIVGAKDDRPVEECRREIALRRIPFAAVAVHEDGAVLFVRVLAFERTVREERQTLARARPAQTVAARISAVFLNLRLERVPLRVVRASANRGGEVAWDCDNTHHHAA
jgi:hypothetical protein